MADLDTRLRTAAMAWLDAQGAAGRAVIPYADLAAFDFEGHRIALIDRQKGIRKPAGFAAALSIRTTYTPPGQRPPYADARGPDGLLRYAYRGDDPEHPDNVAVRRAMTGQLPLIWFVGVDRGRFAAIYPVWVLADEVARRRFVLELDDARSVWAAARAGDEASRRYVDRVTAERLHQPVFRARVLDAYAGRCAMCRLQYLSLLDAAHILPDGHPRGDPVVPNGLALCKIHHAAYDQDLLGIRPDLVVEVREDIRRDRDGPMLRHGLQELDGTSLWVPARPAARPDPDRLEERYAQFRKAG